MPAQTGRTLVYLLRHGATEWNAEQRVMGRRPVPLSSAGAAQIRALAPGLRALGLGSVWTSPVARARETADIVAGVLDHVPVRELEDLAEVDYAQWEGRRFKELFDDPVFREHLTDPLRSRAPGGGENLVEVGERVARALLVAACLGLDASALRRIRIDPGGLSALALGGPWPEVCFLNRETVSVRMGEGAE